MADLHKFYDNAISKGVIDPEVDYNSFVEAMKDANERKSFYLAATRDGLRIGTEQEFGSYLNERIPGLATQQQPTDNRDTTERQPAQPSSAHPAGGVSGGSLLDEQEELARQNAIFGATNDPNNPFVGQKKQPNAWQTFYKGLGAGVINTANGLLGFLNRANSGQLANDPVTLQQMAKQGKSPEEIAQAVDATRARLDSAETERYNAWKNKADQLAAEAKPDGGEKSFTDYLNPQSDDFDLGKALQLGLGTAAESLPYTASALNPVATAAMIMSMSEQNYRQALIDNPDMSEGKRIASAVGNAAIEMAVERIGNPFKVFKAGKLTAPTATKWIKDVVKQSKDNIYKGILRVLGFGAKEAGKEGLEEVVTTEGQDLYNTLLDWKDTNGLGLQSQWERMKEQNPDITPEEFAMYKAEGLTNDFIGGALSGMMMSGPSTGVGVARAAKYYSKNGGSEESRAQAQQQLAVLQQLATEFDVSQEEVAQAIVDYQAEKQLTPKQQALINRGEEIITNLQNAQSATQATEPQEPVQETTPLSPAAAEHQRVVDEVTQSVRERTHGNGYIYPVAMPGNAEKTGYIVGEVVPVIDESNPEQLRIENDDIVTVKWSDGTVTQERARDLDLIGDPMQAQQAIDIDVENRMYDYTQQRIQNGEQPVLMRNSEGILEGFFPTEGGLLEDQNGVQYTPEQLAEQGWQETKPVLFVNDTQQIAALDNGDGTYTQVDALGNPIAEPMSAEAFSEQGFAMVPLEEEQPKSQAPVEAPVVEQASVEQQAPEVQQPEVQAPAAPVVPNIETMSAADYAGAAVEYMGSREYVDEYLDGEIKKVQQQLDVANRKKVGNVTDMADFKAKKDAIEAEKKALQDRLDKLTEAREKAKSYLTIAEREQRAQAEAERRAAEEAARIAREQAAAAEAARLEQERIDRELKKGVPDFSEDNDRDARARGFHVVNGQVIRRQAPLTPIAVGKPVMVQFAKGKNGEAEAVNVLININELQPSHINGQRNPAFFVSEMQPKDRRDQVSKVTAQDAAQNIHPGEIIGGTTAYVGSPVVLSTGEVVQGNWRGNVLIEMYRNYPESVAKYKQALIDNAASLNLTEQDIERIKNEDVISVRMLKDLPIEQAIQLGQKKATDLETGGVQLIDPQVTATQLGDKIERFANTLLKSDDEEASLADLTLRNGKPALDFLQSLNIISPAQMQSAFDSRGNMTAETKAALQGVLKQVLFKDAKNDNLPIMFDDIPLTAQKAILQTIVRDIKTKDPDAKLTPHIQEAIGALYRALHQSAEVKNGRNEQEIRAAMRFWALQMQFPSDFDAENFVPSEKFSNFALELATLFKYGKQTDIAKALNAYYDAVQGTTGGLFGDTPAIPRKEAIKQIFGIDYKSVDEARREKHRKELTDYLNTIADEAHPFELYGNDNVIEILKELGADAITLARAQELIDSGESVLGIKGNGGRLLLNSDSLADKEAARSKYVHERQHLLTTQEQKENVLKAASVDELKLIVKVFTNGSDFYDRAGEDEIADEFISYSMEEAYAVESDEELESILRAAGANDELINIIKSINNEQRENDERLGQSERLGNTRRHTDVDTDSEGHREQGGRDQRTESGVLEPKGARPDTRGELGGRTGGENQGGTEGAGLSEVGSEGVSGEEAGGAGDNAGIAGENQGSSGVGQERGLGEVTPFEKTRLGLVAAKFRRQHPDANVGILFREKDTYEFYDKDAVRAAEILGLQTTEKDGVPFLSFPLDKLQDYLGKLVRGGMKIGITRKPDHKPTKGDYQIGDSFTYDGKTATIQDFTYFGTAILDVEGRRVEVSKEQLDDILDYGDYMYHVGEIVNYKGKRAQIVEFASGDPVIEVEGEGEKRYVSFSDIQRIKKDSTPSPSEEEQQQAAQYLNEALQEVISKSGDKLPKNITIDENTIEDNPDSVEMTARLLIDGKPSDFSVTIFDQSLGARGGFDPVNMVKFYPREMLDKWNWDLADKLAEEFNEGRSKEQGFASVLDESDAVYFFNMQAALDFAGKARQEIAPTENREKSETKASQSNAAEIEIGGALVDRLGDMGLNVSTDLAANRQALKEAKADKSEAGAIHYYKTPSGQQYGFSYKGKVYLDPTKINAELPIHEYGHLWAEALRRLNPENWQHVVDTIKSDKDAWEFVKSLRPELTDENEIVEEVIATFSGKRGAERLRAEYKKMHGKDADYKSKWGNIFRNISKAIQDFWKAVGDFLNIKYQSAEQIYDQVLKDFVDNMNPWKRVSDYLQARDNEYVQAAESGDMKKATNLFYDALKENIGNGITPYMSVGTYTQLKRLAKGVKTRNEGVIKEAAAKIAPLIPDNAVLIPAPSHDGRATDMLDLAKAVAEITGSEVADVLRSAPRESQYQAKKATGVPMASGQLGITMEGTLPEGKTPIIIDNVVDSGNTAEACVQAVGRAVVVTIGDSAEQYRHAASLKSAAPVLRDKAGKVIPLSKRFEPKGSRYLGRRMYLSSNDPRFSISGTQVIPVGEKTLVGLHNISAEKLRKALKAGGLANPSAAVIDIARQNHHDYGEVSLVLSSNMVENADGTYAGDAWTPMYPQVEYRQGKQTEKRIKALVKGLPKNLADGIYYRVGEYMDRNRNSSGLEYLFLKNKGEDMPILTNKRRYPDISIEDIYKRLGMEYPGYYDSSSFQAYEQLPEDQLFEFNLWLEKYGREADIQRVKDKIAELREKGENKAADVLTERYSQPLFFNYYDSIGYRILRDERDAGEENIGETLDAADRKIDELGLRNEFEDRKQQMIDSFGYDEVLFAGWTSDGDRRYVKNTVENASRLMNKERETNYLNRQSMNETKAMLMDKLRTLSDIRKHKSQLEPDDEKIREAYEQASNDWGQLGIDFRDYTTNEDKTAYGLDDNPFTAIDTALARLQEAMFKRDPIAFLNREYRYSLPADSEFGTRLKEMTKRIKNLPSRYFETKFRRPVYLNEFANAVVPNDLPQDLRAGLESAGLRLFSYDPNAQGSRRDATLDATAGEGIRFAISGNGYNRNTDEMESIKNNALNNGTFMQAPNGKPTNLDERQWLQVRTRAFKRWFGDWENDPQNASKVLDENGEPLVVFHATPYEFNVFNPAYVGRNTGAAWLGRGMYFSDHKSTYYGKNIMPVFLNIRNAADIYEDNWDKFFNDHLKDFRVGWKGFTYKDYLEDTKGKYDYLELLDKYGLSQYLPVKNPIPRDVASQLRPIFEREGYDGVIAESALFGKDYVAFTPNQIKSATDNDGDFSEENDDIRFSISNQNNDIFYSNAERAVEGIKQEKATPEQWRAMIEKAGGLKAGEDKWIGLSDWLAQQHPTVTPQGNETRSQFVERAAAENKRFTLSKQDLLDYIREHKIQIEEQEYGDVTDSGEFKRLEDEFSELCWNIDEVYTQRWVEANNEVEKFYDEMRNKYGDEYLDALSPDEQRTENYLLDAREVYNKENPDYDDAFQEMVRRYGDDFDMAFWHDGARLFANDNDAAGYYTGGTNQINNTRLQYTTEGLENKREIALTVPTIESWNESDEIHFGDAGPGKAIAWVRFGDATDEQGNNILVIDEIQSKRHQEGREKGYKEPNQYSYEELGRLHDVYNEANDVVAKYRISLAQKYNMPELQRTSPNPVTLKDVINSEEKTELQRLENIEETAWQQYYPYRDAYYASKKDYRPTPAPFEKNWHELAMKRLLRFAAENGYDKVAWTTGDQQARRYDLGKQLEEISVGYNDETGLYTVHVTDKGYDPMDDAYLLADNLDDEGLRRTIGKDLYNRVMEEGKQNGWDIGVILSGDNLVIGTDGMKGFYDDMLPRFMQKYGKKWGVQVGEVTMPQLEDGYQTMHAIDINDAMRESVMEGQPMFSISGRGVNGTMKPQEGETRSQYIARVAETVKNMTPRNTTIDDAIRFSITVNHNSPYLLKRADGAFVDPETGERLGFDLRFIGKGEGGQAHGYGSYFSANDIREYAERGGITNDVYYKGKYFDYLSDWDEEKFPVDATRVMAWFTTSGFTNGIDVSTKQGMHDALDNAIRYYRRMLEDPQDRAMNGSTFEKTIEVINELHALVDQYGDDIMVVRAEKHHYVVEIPDNDGTNYYEEDSGIISNEEADRIIKVLSEDPRTDKEINFAQYRKDKTREELISNIVNIRGNSRRAVYRNLSNVYGSDRIASELLRKAGFVGIHYDGRRDGECYVIFNPDDAVITDHIRFAVSGREKNTEKEGGNLDIREKIRNFAARFARNGKGFDENNHLRSARRNGSGVLGEAAGRMEATADRGDIRVLEPELPVSDRVGYFLDLPRTEQRARTEAESQRLIGLAKENGLFIERKDTEKFGTKKNTITRESTVYEDKEHGKHIKIKDPYALAALKGNYPEDAIYEHIIHNLLFPDTRYTFMGISEDLGDVRFVFSQETVDAIRNATDKEVDAYMKRLGLRKADKYTYENEQVRVTDVTGDNALVDKDGNVRFIDPVISLKVPARTILDDIDESEFLGENIRFSVVRDPKKVKELETGKKIKVYRAAQVIDDKLYPPMAAKQQGQLVKPIELGRWEQAEEHPELAKDGKFKLDKANGSSVVPAAYNPYFHTSRSPLNDQFSSAYDRPNLVTLEVEVPASELTSGYKAEGAKDAVGETSWHSGAVSGKLAKVGEPRKVILSRWDKPLRIVPDAEVAEKIAGMLAGKDIAIPYNVVTPSLRAELEKQGVTISDQPSGTVKKPKEEIRFSVNNPSTLSRSEIVTKALVQQANNNYNIMQSALKKVTADLKGIRAAMRMQSDYDRKVVDALLNLYNTLLQENGVWAQYMPDTTRRIATQIVHAIGKQNITEEVNTIMDHMVHAQAKAAQRQWDKLRQTPIDKINISGVVMQGKVALQGQHALKALNEALDPENGITLLTLRGDHTDPNNEVDGLIDQLMQMEDNATDESQKLQYKGQWIGYEIAAQYLERIQHIQEERKQLDIELQAALRLRAIKQSARQQLVANIQQAMRDNYIAQADAYAQSAKDLAEYVTTQEEQAKDFIHRQDANRDKIRSYAQRDLEGLATNPNRDRTRGNIARQIWDAFSSPIRDLQSLLRLTGMHAPDGEGYLYNHFMRGWMDGADKERLGIVNAGKTLDAKITGLTHGKYKTWEEAARKIDDASHNMFTITMLNGVDGKDMPVEEEIPLNAGNALYIYAVNKMTDGRMKLAGMNITEEDVKALTDKVREQFGQEILDVVDWVQSEYFSQLRNRYNPTHEALFGAPMDAVENYFPLRINANARQQNEDLSEPDTDAARLLAGTSTGAIKRRTKNSLPLDVRNADFFQEVIRHISQMERWNAFAQWNRDANILFSDINFRNRIKGMNGTIYGSGDKLYNYMKDAFRVAIGTYKPKTDTFSEITLNVAKGVTSAKINFRTFTALKQIASFPAFFTYMQDGTFVGSYLRNWLKPHETMKWAKENLPNFEKRVSKRDMGDMRLMQRTTDWQLNKRILELSSKYGMYFNVLFDTLTCATGARAVYDSRYAEYIKKGYSLEQAEQRARQDAEQAFNTSQQSSEGAFMAPIQMDRNAVTAALTVFRTSPMQYTRNFFYHTRNLLRKFGRGSKEEQIVFRMGQYKNDGLNDEQARKAAEKDYNKSIRADVTGVVVYGALLGILWRLVGSFPYLFFGDDDDKKKQIVMDAVTGGAFVQPITGLIGGSYIESALDGNGLISSMFAPELPFTQDAKRAEQYLQNNKYAEFASQALSVLMQSGTGFDPQTAADMIQRIVTTIDSEEELDAATKAIQISFAVASVPQSQYEQKLIDRVVADESEYDAALADYIRYQKVHTAPLTWWLRGEESDEKAEENAEKRFDRLLNERDELHNPEKE